MKYEVVWNTKSLDSLKKIDTLIRRKIFEKVVRYLAQDPINIGKPLKNDMSGFWRYRYGNYRIIYVVDMETRTIKVLDVGHRKRVYSDKG